MLLGEIMLPWALASAKDHAPTFVTTSAQLQAAFEQAVQQQIQQVAWNSSKVGTCDACTAAAFTRARFVGDVVYYAVRCACGC